MQGLCKIGITALGSRKKILHALNELRTEGSAKINLHEKIKHKETNVQVATYKLITEFFPGKPKKASTTVAQVAKPKTDSNDGNKRIVSKTNFSVKKFREIPPWCSITGAPTPFRVVSFNILIM